MGDVERRMSEKRNGEFSVFFFSWTASFLYFDNAFTLDAVKLREILLILVLFQACQNTEWIVVIFRQNSR